MIMVWSYVGLMRWFYWFEIKMCKVDVLLCVLKNINMIYI